MTIHKMMCKKSHTVRNTQGTQCDLNITATDIISVNPEKEDRLKERQEILDIWINTQRKKLQERTYVHFQKRKRSSKNVHTQTKLNVLLYVVNNEYIFITK
jgi:hypothetical protein